MSHNIIDFWNGTNPLLHFTINDKNGKSFLLELDVKKLIHCGRTARDQGRVPSHVALAPNSGSGRPASGPIAFLVPPVNATTSENVQVYDNKNNGEVEPVFLFDEKGNIYITTGSDHADRSLESIAGPKSKLWMPKVMANSAWLYEDVIGHWDELILRMWGYPGGSREPYMDDKIGRILPPDTLMNIAKEQSGISPLKDTVIFGGSIPFLTKEMMWGPAWDIELFDPILSRSIRHHYNVEVMWV